MKRYSIDFVQTTRKGEELALRMEFEREFFSNREYRNYLICTLFDLACEGIEYAHLTAYLKCEGETIMTAKCDTETDGETITAYICAARPREKFRPMRTMVIAQ